MSRGPSEFSEHTVSHETIPVGRDVAAAATAAAAAAATTASPRVRGIGIVPPSEVSATERDGTSLVSGPFVSTGTRQRRRPIGGPIGARRRHNGPPPLGGGRRRRRRRDDAVRENTGLMAGAEEEVARCCFFFQDTGWTSSPSPTSRRRRRRVTYREDALPKTDLSHLAVGRVPEARAARRRASRVAAETRSR